MTNLNLVRKTGVANAGDLKYLGINYNILHKKNH